MGTIRRPTVAFDDFESEDRMFSFQASGDAEPSVSRAEVPQVVGDAPSQGVLMSIKQAKAGQKASVVFTAKKGRGQAGPRGGGQAPFDDLQCLAFDAGVADSKESDMGRLLRVSVHGIDGSWIDLTPESFGPGGAIPLSLRVPIPKDKRDEINWDEFYFQIGAHVHFVRRRDGPGLLFRQRGACQRRRRAVRLHGWNVHGGSGGDGLVRPARGAVP